MQEKRVKGKPARRRNANPHYAPRGLDRRYVQIYPEGPKPFVGLSDGRIYDPRSRHALDWWGMGTGKPEIYQAPGTESTGIWQIEFADGGAVCTPNGIHVVVEPQQGQLRVQLAVDPRRGGRRLRRERQAGRRPIAGTPLLMSTRVAAQEWPPPEPPQATRWH